MTQPEVTLEIPEKLVDLAHKEVCFCKVVYWYIIRHTCELNYQMHRELKYICTFSVSIIHSLIGTCGRGWPNKGRRARGAHRDIYLRGQWARAVQCCLDSSQSPASSISSQHELSLHPDYQRSSADGLRTVHMYRHQYTREYQRNRDSAGYR